MFYVLLLTDKTRTVLSQASLTQEQILGVSHFSRLFQKLMRCSNHVACLISIGIFSELSVVFHLFLWYFLSGFRFISGRKKLILSRDQNSKSFIIASSKDLNPPQSLAL